MDHPVFKMVCPNMFFLQSDYGFGLFYLEHAVKVYLFQSGYWTLFFFSKSFFFEKFEFSN